ncbi:MAG: cysteine synthase family protein [Deltaproteobacteria bacterium]|nr:cysteine synthase family protein [Deltaproteobacteria bacterium]
MSARLNTPLSENRVSYGLVKRRLLDAIGDTPLMDVSGSNTRLRVRILAKAEFMNPGGSIKDRTACQIIKDGIKTGKLDRSKILIDSTSGNTGIAYSMICASLGLRAELVVPGNINTVKRKIMEAFGAKLILSDPLEGSEGAHRLAQRIYERSPERYFFGNQYGNNSNFFAHYNFTGTEILKQTKGKLTHFVAAFGTGGTIFGVGKRLKNFNPEIKVICVQPDDDFHGIEGLRYVRELKTNSIYVESVIDEVIHVKTEDAYKAQRLLAKETGIFVGFSSGASFFVASQIASSLKKGLVVTIFPDRGDRYLS